MQLPLAGRFPVNGPRAVGAALLRDRQALVPLICVLLLLWIVVMPLFSLILASFQERSGPLQTTFTFDNYLRAYLNPRTYETLASSVVFTVGVCALTLFIALPAAWIVERTNTPLRRSFYVLGLVPLVIPGVLNTMAWIFLLEPNIGWINLTLMGLLGLEEAPFNIYSFPGMIWVQALASTPLAFLLLSASLKSMDPALEEAATMSGGGNLQTVRRVTLPLVSPAIIGVLLLIGVRALSAFEVPALIGLPNRIFVLSSEVYRAFNAMVSPDFGYGTALAVGLLSVSAVGVWMYGRSTRQSRRFETVSGKAYRPRMIDLGPWRFVGLAFLMLWAALLVVLPGMITVWTSLLKFFRAPTIEALNQVSLDNYVTALTTETIQQSALNSLILAVTAATGVVLLAAVISWITVKSTLPGRRIMDYLAFLPIGIPGLVLGVAMIQMFINFPLPVYGTLFVLFFAYMNNYLPFGMRSTSASMVQVNSELEEAAKISGASWWQTFRRVLLPLIRPGILAGWIYIFVVAWSEITTAIMLAGRDTTVLSVRMYFLYGDGRASTVAAIGVVMVLALLAIVSIVTRLGGKFGIER